MIWLQPPFGMLSFNCSLLRTLCSLLHLLNLETSAWNIPHKLPIKKKVYPLFMTQVTNPPQQTSLLVIQIPLWTFPVTCYLLPWVAG